MAASTLLMDLPTLNSEYCYMLTSCDFASTIGDLTKVTGKEGSMHPLDIVKQAVQELLEGRDHDLSPAERDDMKLSLARLLLCLMLRARLTDEPELAEFLALFPDMGEHFLATVVIEAGLVKAFVQNLCELDVDVGQPILSSMTSSLVDPAQLFFFLVQVCDQLSRLVANKASLSVKLASNAHAYLRRSLSVLEPPSESRDSAELIGEFIGLLDSYVDAYCVKEARRETLTSMYNVCTDADRIFADLFMLSHGLYVDAETKPEFDTNATKLLHLLDELVKEIDMAKIKSDAMDFYQLWLQARRLRQVLRHSEDRIIASKIEKFESRLRYRLLKVSKFTDGTKIDDCFFILDKNLYKREISGLLIDMLSESANCAKIVPFLEKNLIYICDSSLIGRLIKVTRLTKIQSKSKKCKTQLYELLRKAFLKGNLRVQNEVLHEAHKEGIGPMTFDNDSMRGSIQVLNRLTLKDEPTQARFSDVAWLVLQNPRNILEQIIQMATSNSDYCKVVHNLLEAMPNIGLIQIGDENQVSNLVLCAKSILATDLTEQQENNVIYLYCGLLQSPCLNLQQLVLDLIFRHLNVEAVKAQNRSPFNFSLSLLERILELDIIWQVANIPSIMSVLYCLCEVVDYTGQEVYHKNHSAIKERSKIAIKNLAQIWREENFDPRVAVWLEDKLHALGGMTQFIFHDFEPYPQKRTTSTLIRSTVDILRAQEPSEIHSAVLTILWLACMSDTLLRYYQNMTGERKVPYSVLVTSLVQRMPNCTMEELVRTYELIAHWLRKGTVTVRDRRVAVVPYVCKMWLDALLVFMHPDMGWVETGMKVYVVRNYAQLLKRMSSDCEEVENQILILQMSVEAVSKVEQDIAEPIMILTLDAIKILKTKNADLSVVRKQDVLSDSKRSDMLKIALNLQ